MVGMQDGGMKDRDMQQSCESRLGSSMDRPCESTSRPPSYKETLSGWVDKVFGCWKGNEAA